MHYLLAFVAGFTFCAILIVIFGKKVDAAAKSEGQKLKADLQKSKDKLKSKL